MSSKRFFKAESQKPRINLDNVCHYETDYNSDDFYFIEFHMVNREVVYWGFSSEEKMKEWLEILDSRFCNTLINYEEEVKKTD